MPGSNETPASTGESTTGAEYIGYWDWTWHPSGPPAGANMGIAFSGWAKVETAVQQSSKVKDKLQGDKYICIGGGNDNGAFRSNILRAVTDAINEGTFAGYDGIAYDVEVGDPGLESLFSASFAAAKAAGFKVLVTISHSAPFGISDAATLMRSFFDDDNIDFLSPQLYTTGKETQNDYATSHGVEWSEYAKSKAIVAPSIVKADLYASAVEYFKGQGVDVPGFVQWAHVS